MEEHPNAAMRLFFILILASSELIFQMGDCKRTEILEPNGKYNVSWEVNFETDVIYFEVNAKTSGFVGFGLSPNGGMLNADIIIGGVGNNGNAYFTDRHGIGTAEPTIDQSQDWNLISASESGDHTQLKFSRLLNTCDDNDISITEDTLNLIWALGDSDNIKYHGSSSRGSLHVNLLDPPIPSPDLSRYKTWIIQTNDTMPQEATSYWCTIHKRPNLDKIHHVVGFDKRFENVDAWKHTHHFIFRQCITPVGVDPTATFEHLVEEPGQACKARPLLTSYCSTYMFVWAIGGKKTMFPEDVGFPFRSTTESEYFMLEIHYDNPETISDLKFPTGLEVYYTENLREKEAGIMTLGHVVWWAQTIPPNSSNFTTYGHCSPECTRYFPEDGLNVFNILLHSHMSGRKLKLHHFRGEEELPWFAFDNRYDFNYQQNRPLKEIKKIYPGDHLTMTCVTDTTWKNGTVTIGDLGISDEMCEAFLFYYPRISVDTCMSTYNPLTLLNDFGIKTIKSAGVGNMDPIITLPKELNGTFYTDYLNKQFDWSEEFRIRYQAKLRESAHIQVCMSFSNTSFAPKLFSAKYPLNITAYQPPNTCEREQIANSFKINSNIILITFALVLALQ